MTAQEVLERIHSAGGSVTAQGDKLKFRAPEPLPADVMDLAKAYKPELLVLLSGGDHQGLGAVDTWRDLPPAELEKLDIQFGIVAPDNADRWALDDWVEWIGERSAILEFDAEYSRTQADSEAVLIWQLYRREKP